MNMVDKNNYNDSDIIVSRVSRNSNLYKEFYSGNNDLENLPLSDNTNEIDIDKLKEIISGYNNEPSVSNNFDSSIFERKTRNIDKDRIYDINKLLEKAKYDNVKLKDSESELLKTSRNILSRLEVDSDNVGNDLDTYNSSVDSDVNNLSSNGLEMTREMKYHTKQLSVDPIIEQVMPDNDLAMDLFFDLKPTGDTIVTKPIKDNSISNNSVNREIDTKSVDDTSDIDIIKKGADGVDNDFFTSSYEFSSKDFNDDFSEEGSSGGILKIILLIIGIIALVALIVYFVINFGLGV